MFLSNLSGLRDDAWLNLSAALRYNERAFSIFPACSAAFAAFARPRASAAKDDDVGIF